MVVMILVAGIHRYSSTGSMPASHDQPMVILFDPSHALTPVSSVGERVTHPSSSIGMWMVLDSVGETVVAFQK